MKTQVIYNEDLHLEHNQWNMELNFWIDELKTFENRLEELVQKWTEVEVLAKGTVELSLALLAHALRVEQVLRDANVLALLLGEDAQTRQSLLLVGVERLGDARKEPHKRLAVAVRELDERRQWR